MEATSAKPGVDFIQNTAKQIQFDPGIIYCQFYITTSFYLLTGLNIYTRLHVLGNALKTWQVTVPDDGLEERKEKFRVYLHSPLSTILDPKKLSTTVTLLDARHKSCSPKSKGILL